MIRHTLIPFLLCCTLCFAQKNIETKDSYEHSKFSTEIEMSKKLITALMTEKNIPGLSITVAKKDLIIWSEGFGFADLENKTPVALNTKFRIGSISKSMTAIALGKLLEERKLFLDDQIDTHVPYFPQKKYPITIKTLASHTAGIRNYNYRNGEYFSDKAYSSVKESIDIFKKDSLLFQPNTNYGYSTYGYVLLSAVIEAVTDKNYLNYMQKEIFIPMNMHHTVPDFNDSIVSHRSRFYQEDNGLIVNASYIDNSNKWPVEDFYQLRQI